MKALFGHELRMNRKSLVIWLLCVGGVCLSCILLFTSVKDSMKDMADAFASMGAFSTVFGMDRLSLATVSGYYGTEVCIIHALGGAMFAAILGSTMLSKEEDGHTSEFLCSLPVSRRQIVFTKWAVLFCDIVVFQVICAVVYAGGFLILGEVMEWDRFLITSLAQLILYIEIGAICFFISACSRKNKVGIGLGIVLLLYAVDTMARIIPAIDGLKYITPFYYANATDVLYTGKVNGPSLGIGITVLIMTSIGSYVVYEKKDLAS